MASRATWLSTLSIVFASVVLFATGRIADAMDPDSWDFVTANDSQIIFLKNGTIVPTDANISFVHAIASNNENRTLYIGGKSKIFGLNFDEEKMNLRIIPICKKIDKLGPVMSGMVFDPVTNSLIWYDTMTKALSKVNVASNGDCSEMETVLHLPGLDNVVITMDICNRFVYWAYSPDVSNRASKVERVRLDGTDREKIVSDGEWPGEITLAVDNYAGKLYFGRKIPSSSNFTIEKSNLDGTDRKVLVNGTDHKPLRLAVDETAVYWTDELASQTIWKVYKNGTGKREVTSLTRTTESILSTPGKADCKRGARISDGSSSSSPSSVLPSSETSASVVPTNGSSSSSPSSVLPSSETSDSVVPTNGSSTLPGVDPMVVLLPQALAIMWFLYRQTRIGLW